MKELMSSKEIEECRFTPVMATRKKGEQTEKRNLDKFLED